MLASLDGEKPPHRLMQGIIGDQSERTQPKLAEYVIFYQYVT